MKQYKSKIIKITEQISTQNEKDYDALESETFQQLSELLWKNEFSKLKVSEDKQH